MYTLTSHDLEFIEETLRVSKRLAQEQITIGEVLSDPNATEKEKEDAFRQIGKRDKEIRGLMKQREDIIRRAFNELFE